MKSGIRLSPIGIWHPAKTPPSFPVSPEEGLRTLGKPLFLVEDSSGLQYHTTGFALIGNAGTKASGLPLLAGVHPLPAEKLGNPVFCERHGLRYAYVAGAMAHGISSEKMVVEIGRAGGLGFFGSGGCSTDRIEKAIQTLQAFSAESPFPYGFNFLHCPGDPARETVLAELYLKNRVTTLCAAAFVRITKALVLYRLHGLKKDADGRPIPKNRILAKVSRVEMAEQFLEPPPEKIVRELLAEKKISAEEASLSQRIPMADDMTAEADSGGHTDNRPALVLLGVLQNLRDRIQAEKKYHEVPCIGLGGGIGTPASCAAAFSMGADYVLVGSVHQACGESGTSPLVRAMLAECKMTDFAMAPSADMFEMGAQVQVLKKGSMFAMRARKLYRLFGEYSSLEDLPEEERHFLEEKIFKENLVAAWEKVARFWEEKDAEQGIRAEKDSKHKMALLFRSYLGASSPWAIQGVPERKQDFQIWCGPAMGAFNDWTKGTFLALPEKRHVRLVMENFLAGAAIRLRHLMLKTQYPWVDPDPALFQPMDAAKIRVLLKNV